MTSPSEAINQFRATPYELWSLRGKEITIAEDIDMKTGTFRQAKDIDKFGKPTDYYYIRVAQGLYEKDMRLKLSELQSCLICIPEAVKNLDGVTLAIDAEKNVKYLGGGSSSGQSHAPSAPIQPTQPVHPADQTAQFLDRLAAGIRAVNSIGTDVTTGDIIKMADKITPGKALDLINAAKAQGFIYEKDGIVKVP